METETTSAATAATQTASAPVNLPEPTPVPETMFEIGLVMAGAISAGAYTAGVIDFLHEALNNWYDPALQQQHMGWSEAQPIHEVRLKTMAGASAGGMCAALTAVSLLDGSTARFKKAWVEDIDIRKLLATGDLDQVKSLEGLQSVLNCEVLKTIANEAITLPSTPPVWPRWLDKQLDFYLTLTNLNGLTYEVAQAGGSPQRFTDHADRIQFRLLAPGTPPVATRPDELRVLRAAPWNTLTPQEQADWNELKDAALATGAFPVALLNRELSFSNAYFDKRAWWYGGQQWPGSVSRAGLLKTEPSPYLFVDGGVTNNAPLELVRRTLANSIDGTGTNPREGHKARRALLLIDPFPSEVNDGTYQHLPRDLRRVVPRLLQAMLNQSRFRAEDLLSALDLDVNSRFVVAPLREPDDRNRTTPSLACGSLNAFGGFLHQGFRQHDYALGRRNCQRFLQQWFTLPAANALFGHWPTPLKQAWQQSGPPGADGQPGEDRLPIIPLLGSSMAEVPAPVWAEARLPAARLDGEIGPILSQRIGRFTELLQAMIPRHLSGWWWVRVGYPWFIRPKIRSAAYKWIMKKVRQNLEANGLLHPAAK